MLALLPLCVLAKLPPDEKSSHVSHDCWAPDYCDPERFEYKLCKLRLRGRKASSEYSCPDGEYCEELECPGSCWLPSHCWCEDKDNATQPHHTAFTHRKTERHGGRDAFHGRMFCEDDGCFKHPSTQWGICRPELTDEEHEEVDEDDESVMPTGFHFWSPDECAPCRRCAASASLVQASRTSLTYRCSIHALNAVLYNSKLHIDDEHHYGRPRTPHRHSKHGEKEEL